MYMHSTCKYLAYEEKRNEKDLERRAQRLLQKKTLHHENGDVQDLTVMKRIKRAAEYDEKKNWRASEASETLFSHVYGISRYIYIRMSVSNMHAHVSVL